MSSPTRPTRRDALKWSALAPGAAVGMNAGRAGADTFPSRAITIVVPFTAGGENDIIARAAASRLAVTLGTSVVVENRPGAGGNLGAAGVARAAPDGYTLLVANVGVFAINPFLFKNLGYDPERDLAPVTQAASVPNVLLVGPAVSAKTLPELMAAIRAEPNGMNYASMGPGTSGHLSGELFKALTGVTLHHVPYRGATPALTDLMAGQVQMMFGNLPTAVPLLAANQLRGLAVTGRTRHPAVPHIPTLIELGVRDYDVVTWFGFAAPAGTPELIVQRLQTEIAAALKHADVAPKLQAIGLELIANSPSEFRRFIADERTKWKRIVEMTKITL